MSIIHYGALSRSVHEIRLLRIHQLDEKNSNETVECSLYKTTLDPDNPPKYHALSYVWGDPRRQSFVVVNGCKALIRASLEVALRQIRSRGHDNVVWADAICMNQTDRDERSHQVSLMGLVYSKAVGVIAWLGEASDDSEIAFQAIEELERFRNTYFERVRKGEESGKMNQDMLEAAERYAPKSTQLSSKQALRKLGNRPYWSRTWIVQELWLAKQVQFLCGSRELSLERLRAAWTMQRLVDAARVAEEGVFGFRPGNDPLDSATMPMGHLLIHTLARNNLLPFERDLLPLKVVADTARLNATDPRDKVFGMMGFIHEASPCYELVQPNYNKTVVQVYTDFARYTVLAGRSLDSLAIAGLSTGIRQNGDLPSWVPDLREPRSAFGTIGFPTNESKGYRAENIQDFVSFPPDPAVLCCKGQVLDRIMKIWPRGLFPFWKLEEGDRMHSDFPSFAHDILSGFKIGEDTLLYSLYRLVGARKGFSREAKRKEYFEEAATFLRYAAAQVVEQGLFPLTYAPATLLEYLPPALVLAFLGRDASINDREALLEEMLAVDMEKSQWFESYTQLRVCQHLPFMTVSGKLGLGTYAIEPGDTIMHLPPHNHAILLRSDGDHYFNYGECFVLDLDLPAVTDGTAAQYQEVEIR